MSMAKENSNKCYQPLNICAKGDDFYFKEQGVWNHIIGSSSDQNREMLLLFTFSDPIRVVGCLYATSLLENQTFCRYSITLSMAMISKGKLQTIREGSLLLCVLSSNAYGHLQTLEEYQSWWWLFLLHLYNLIEEPLPSTTSLYCWPHYDDPSFPAVMFVNPKHNTIENR